MINSVIKYNLCAGCGLCESIAKNKICVGLNKSGYYSPLVSESLSKDENFLINRCCPSINAVDCSKKGDSVIWGPIIHTSVGYAVNSTTRYNGSSGGVLSAFAIYLLESKQVDGIIHCGSLNSNPLYNDIKVSTTVNDIINSAGSRYSPSSPLKNILQVVSAYEKMAFIGKPCDVMGLRNLMVVHPHLTEKIPFVLSFMCAGVPSINGTISILKAANVDHQNLKYLRYRGEGWPGYFKAESIDGHHVKMSYNQSWGEHLNKYIQFRCKICSDGIGEFADIVCADAWESSESGFPSFEEREGLSLIISRTIQGFNLYNEACRNGAISIQENEISVNRIGLMQPYQLNRKKNILPRILAMKLSGFSIPNYNFRTLIRASLLENPLRILKNFIGMLIRLRRQKGN